jgi:alanyl aminopeptidase
VTLVIQGQTPATGVPPTQPELRLPPDARPIRQTVELTVTPSREDFAGTTEIELELKQATSLLWLNASHLTIQEARVTAGNTSSAARVVPGGDHFVGFAFEKAVGPGAARLRIAYEGALSRRDPEGLFAQQEAGAGAARHLAQVLETIDLCSAYKQAQQASVVKFLAKY